MTIEEYEKLVTDTMIYSRDWHIVYPALGLAGESGEVCEKIKKHIREGADPQTLIQDEHKRALLLKECGDVLWYVVALAKDLQSNLHEVMQINYNKLKDRDKRGVLHGSGDER